MENKRIIYKTTVDLDYKKVKKKALGVPLFLFSVITFFFLAYLYGKLILLEESSIVCDIFVFLSYFVVVLGVCWVQYKSERVKAKKGLIFYNDGISTPDVPFIKYSNIKYCKIKESQLFKSDSFIWFEFKEPIGKLHGYYFPLSYIGDLEKVLNILHEKKIKVYKF